MKRILNMDDFYIAQALPRSATDRNTNRTFIIIENDGDFYRRQRAGCKCICVCRI